MCPATAGSLGWSNKPKAKVHMISVAVTGIFPLRSGGPLQPILATRSLLFLNVLPRCWRNALVAPELCHQSSAELLLARPLGSFLNSRPPMHPSSSLPSRPHALLGSRHAALQRASNLLAWETACQGDLWKQRPRDIRLSCTVIISRSLLIGGMKGNNKGHPEL